MSTSEQSIIRARASVMVYDEGNKKWLPSGGSSGLSHVHIYQNTLNNTFRIVGRKLQDHELVINCAILKGLKYNTATSTFHNWRDSRQVYGLNFSTKEDANNFAETMTQVLDILNTSPSPSSGGINIIPTSMVNNSMLTGNSNNMINNHGKQPMGQQMPPTPPQPPSQQQVSIPPQPVYGHTGCPPPEYSEVWGVNSGNTPNSVHNSNWTNNDVNEWKQAQINEINNLNHHHVNHTANQNINHIMVNVAVPPSQATYGILKAPSNAPNNPGMINLSQPGQQVQPPIQSGQQQMQTPQQAMYTSRPENTMSAPIPPPPPPPPPIGGLNTNMAPNPPPLPPGGGSGPVMVNSNANNSNNIKSVNPIPNLASALSNVKLKKSSGRDDKDSDTTSKTSSSGSIGMGMASMMDEMNRTLARRRALAEGNQNDANDSTGGNEKRNWDAKINRNSPNKDSNESNAQRLRAGSLDTSTMNGIDQLKIDQLKQEILSEIRREITKMKSEIIDAIKLELRGFA